MFVNTIERTRNKTNVCSTFVSDNTVKPMVFLTFLSENTVKPMVFCNMCHLVLIYTNRNVFSGKTKHFCVFCTKQYIFAIMYCFIQSLYKTVHICIHILIHSMATAKAKLKIHRGFSLKSNF